MKRIYIHITFLILLLLSGGLAFGQGGSKAAVTGKVNEHSIIPAQYIFFHGDTLDGMDLNSLFNDLGRYHTIVHLSEAEKQRYMYFRQREFIRVKYHLPGRKFEDPAASPDLMADRKHPSGRNKDFIPGSIGSNQTQQAGSNGSVLRQGGGGVNPTIQAIPCVDLDFEAPGAGAQGNPSTAFPANWSGNVMYATPGNFEGTSTSAGWVNGVFNAAINDAVNSNAGNVCSFFTLVNAGTDPYAQLPMNMPFNGSTFSYRLGGPYVNLGGNGSANNTYQNICGYTYGDDAGSSVGYNAAGEIIKQSITVTAGVNDLLVYYYNVLLADGGHPPNEQPYFNAQVLNNGGANIGCSVYTQECTVGVPPPGYSTSATQWGPFPAQVATNVYFSGWQTNVFDLSPYAGTTVTLEFMTAGCGPGGHMGYAYVDGSCGPKVLAIAAPPYCGGTNYTISAPKVPTGSLFSWTGIGIVGSTTGSFITVNNSPGVTTTYTYSVAITPPPPNNSGTCQFSVSGTMTYSPTLTASTTSVTNVSCFGSGNGSAVASNSGGTAPFTYTWAPSGGALQTASSLGVGNYTVTVTDTHGCSSSSTAQIRQPGALTVGAAATNPTSWCGTGTVTATPAGGTPGYAFSWTGGAVAQTVSGLAAASYTVTVTDSKACTSTSTTSLVAPAGQPTVWGGTTSIDWFTPSNWNPACLPNCASDVSIPSGTPFAPTISAASTAACRTLNLLSGATLTLSAVASELDICGDYNQAGKINTNNGLQGTIKFKGSVPQNFISSGQGVNFYKVVLANTSNPPNLIIKEGSGYNDLIVSSTGTFTFTSGIVYTEGGKKVVMRNTTPAALSGYGATAYINGRIKRYIAIGDYDFPVGGTPIVGNVYPYELMNVNFTALGGLDSLTVSFGNPGNYVGSAGTLQDPGADPVTGLAYNYGGGGSLADIGGPTTNSGGGNGGLWTAMAGPPTATPTYDMTLTGTNWANNGAANFGHTILKRSPFQSCANWSWILSGTYVDMGGTKNGSGVIAGTSITTKRTGMSGFSQLGQVQDGSALPIELLMFDASCSSNNVLVNWATATETNNNFFTLERSCDEDPFQFQEIAKINGAGNSSTMKLYSYVDKDLTPGECYYRLSQTDYDGKTVSFPLIAINCNQNANFNLVGVVPNPAVDQLNVFFSTSKTDIIHISMTDMLGQHSIVKDVSPETGLNTVELDISSLSVGVYFVKVDNGSTEFIKKVVKR